MIDALIAGHICGTPEERTSRTGSPFVTAKIRTPMANGDSNFVHVIAFRDSAIVALLALQDGDSAALAGELKAGAYLDKAGLPKPSIDLTVHQVLTEYHVARKRKAMTPDAGKPAPRAHDSRDEEIPF